MIARSHVKYKTPPLPYMLTVVFLEKVKFLPVLQVSDDVIQPVSFN